MPDPQYLICDPLPSQVGDRPATYILRIIEPASLWVSYDDSQNEIKLCRAFEDFEKYTPGALAKFAREVGEFWNKYTIEENHEH